MSEILAVPRHLLALLQERLDPHSDAAAWGEVCALLAAPAPDLDQRLRAAGMLSVAKLMAGAPLDAFIKHAGVHNLATFAEWVEMRRKECLRLQARFDLKELGEDHELYEWALAHAAVFTEVHVNLRAALAGLVIEIPLPIQPEEPEDAFDDSWMDEYHGARRMREKCVQAITAAGFEVKP